MRHQYGLGNLAGSHCFERFFPLAEPPRAAHDRLHVECAGREQPEDSLPNGPIVAEAALQADALLHERIERKVEGFFPPTDLGDPAGRPDDLQGRGERGGNTGRVDNAIRAEFVAPATHFASRHENLDYPRLGERLRLKGDFDISQFSPAVQAILKGLKKYGMFVADNGIDWAISVAPDPRIPDLHAELRRIQGAAFEVVAPPQ